MIENQHIEFKQIWKDNCLKSICTFANTQNRTPKNLSKNERLNYNKINA